MGRHGVTHSCSERSRNRSCWLSSRSVGPVTLIEAMGLWPRSTATDKQLVPTTYSLISRAKPRFRVSTSSSQIFLSVVSVHRVRWKIGVGKDCAKLSKSTYFWLTIARPNAVVKAGLRKPTVDQVLMQPLGTTLWT